MLKVHLTGRAQSSLEDITEYYLFKYSAERALKVVQSIEEAFDKISKSPKQFPVCFDIEMPAENIRQAIVHSTFKIVYRIAKGKN